MEPCEIRRSHEYDEEVPPVIEYVDTSGGDIPEVDFIDEDVVDEDRIEGDDGGLF